MKLTIVKLALALMCLAPAPAFAGELDDAALCKMLHTVEKDHQPYVGKMTDQYTRDDGVEIDCAKKTVHFKKFVFANQSDMHAGWQGRKSAQWDNIYCHGEWLDAINRGWSISFTLSTQDGKTFYHKATCK